METAARAKAKPATMVTANAEARPGPRPPPRCADKSLTVSGKGRRNLHTDRSEDVVLPSGLRKTPQKCYRSNGDRPAAPPYILLHHL